MEKKPNFGELSAADVQVGDIVEWTMWNFRKDSWDSHYGVVIELKNKFMGNRLVWTSKIMPINGDHSEIECFTMNLRTISRSENHNNE